LDTVLVSKKLLNKSAAFFAAKILFATEISIMDIEVNVFFIKVINEINILLKIKKVHFWNRFLNIYVNVLFS
jgi:hypothetical protein